MKKAILIHRWDGNPDADWYPWLKTELEARDFSVEIPKMPNPEKPKIESWVSKLQEFSNEINRETYLIGHSIGCQTIMRWLERLSENLKVKGVIFVAPWLKLDEQTMKEEGEEVWEIARPWIEKPINLKKVKEHSDDFTIVYSTSDPYVSSDDLVILQEKLGARAVNMGDMGHFDDTAGIKKLPSIVDIIEEIESRGI